MTIDKDVFSKQSASLKTAERKDLRGIKDYLTKAKIVALTQSPFIYSLLSSAEIKLVDNVPIAAVSKNGVLLVNPSGLMSVATTPKQAVSILLHEALHLGLGHYDRVGERDRRLYNIASDCVINNALAEHGFMIDLPIYERGLVNPKVINNITHVSVNDIKKMDAEAIYNSLDKQAKQPDPLGPPGPSGPLKPGLPQPGAVDKIASKAGFGDKAEDLHDKDVKEEEGETIQEGSPEVYRKVNDEKELDYKKALAKAKVQSAMQAGTIPAGLDRLIDELLEPKVDWHSQLKAHLSRGLGSLVISTWRIPSRRFPYSPGKQMVTKPTAWALVDTSGSISEENLKRFLTEMYSISRAVQVPIKVMCFDAAAYEIHEAKTPGEIVTKVMPKIKGGGGTEIEPALKALLERKNFKRDDAVVVMSDGDIFDLKEDEVQNNFKKIASNASSLIFLSTLRTREDLSKDLPVTTKILEVKD